MIDEKKMSEWRAALSAPFPPDAISWRVGSTTQDKKKGMALAYIDARDVMDRLDEVLGPENWSDKYEYLGDRMVCTISIRCGEGGDWVDKADGAGNTDIEGEKGGISDAFKRAAVKWGIGRYLYRLDSPWVMLTENGKGIASSEYERLRGILAGDKMMSKDPEPSKQAVTIGDAFKMCDNLADLQKSGAANKSQIAALHMVDRRYLTALYEDCRKKFTEKEPT